MIETIKMFGKQENQYVQTNLSVTKKKETLVENQKILMTDNAILKTLKSFFSNTV